MTFLILDSGSGFCRPFMHSYRLCSMYSKTKNSSSFCRECADAKRFEGAHKGQERRAQVSGVLGNQVVKRSIRGTGPENTPYLDTVEVAMGGAPFSPRGVSGVSGGQ